MKTFFISDHHFFHSNILNFLGENGKPIRPDFTDVHHMNEFMIERWNSVVSPKDKVYHLGDIIMRTNRSFFEEIMPKLNGRKVLIKGNHDGAKLGVYADYFKDVRSEIHLKASDTDIVLFTHRPVRLSDFEFKQRSVWNVHGHIHQNIIDDYRYLNVSVEVVNYTPVDWEDIKKEIRIRKEKVL